MLENVGLMTDFMVVSVGEHFQFLKAYFHPTKGYGTPLFA